MLLHGLLLVLQGLLVQLQLQRLLGGGREGFEHRMSSTRHICSNRRANFDGFRADFDGFRTDSGRKRRRGGRLRTKAGRIAEWGDIDVLCRPSLLRPARNRGGDVGVRTSFARLQTNVAPPKSGASSTGVDPEWTFSFSNTDSSVRIATSEYMEPMTTAMSSPLARPTRHTLHMVPF